VVGRLSSCPSTIRTSIRFVTRSFVPPDDGLARRVGWFLIAHEVRERNPAARCRRRKRAVRLAVDERKARVGTPVKTAASSPLSGSGSIQSSFRTRRKDASSLVPLRAVAHHIPPHPTPSTMRKTPYGFGRTRRFRPQGVLGAGRLGAWEDGSLGARQDGSRLGAWEAGSPEVPCRRPVCPGDVDLLAF
jgi:hypothetical protein